MIQYTIADTNFMSLLEKLQNFNPNLSVYLKNGQNQDFRSSEQVNDLVLYKQ